MRTLCEYVHAYMYVNICTHTCKLGVHTTVNLVYMHVNTYPHTCQYIYTLIHTFKYLRTHMWSWRAYIQVYTHTYVNSYAHTVSFHIYVYTCVYIHTHVHTQIRVHVCLCAHSVSESTHGVFHVYMHMYIYLHTHIKFICKQDTSTDMYVFV